MYNKRIHSCDWAKDKLKKYLFYELKLVFFISEKIIRTTNWIWNLKTKFRDSKDEDYTILKAFGAALIQMDGLHKNAILMNLKLVYQVWASQNLCWGNWGKWIMKSYIKKKII